MATHSSSASSKMGFNNDDGFFESGAFGDDDEVNAGNGSDDFHSGEKDAFMKGSESTSRGKGGDDGGFVDMFRRANHPCAAFFHVAFKMAAVLTYFFCTWFTNNFVLVFVVCVILMAFDFLVVKNVSGRLLVGLRWWSDLGEDGKNHWRFESLGNPESVGKLDSRIFWYSLYIYTLTWIVFAILALIQLKFEWLLVDVVALVLASSNLVGYTKCSKDAKLNMQQKVQSVVARGAVAALTGGLGRLFGGGSSGQASAAVAQV